MRKISAKLSNSHGREHGGVTADSYWRFQEGESNTL